MSVRNARTLISIVAFTVVAGAPLHAQQKSTTSAPNWTSVEDAIGRKGAMQPGDVIKFAFPRSDLTVTVNGVQLKPALALGGWVALKHLDKEHALAMGDLVLTEDEVGPVMRRLQEGGVEQTALHNHVLMESPRVMYMHIMAHGDGAKIGKAVHDALALTKTPMTVAAPPASPPAVDIDTAGIARALGYAGKPNGVVYQV